MKSYHRLVTVFAVLTAIDSAQCIDLTFYKEEQTSVDAAMVFDYVEATSVLKCAITCNSVANCTGFIYCNIDNRCSILTSDQPFGLVSVPYPTCKAFSEVMSANAFSEVTTSSQTSPSCQNGGTPNGAACVCPSPFTGGKCETRIEDCKDVSLYIGDAAGTYIVWPTKAAQPFGLECTGGATMIMFRNKMLSGCGVAPVTYLDVPWADYKSGFTHFNCYMWLGLEKMHALTNVRPYKLLISLFSFVGLVGKVLYSSFSVGDEVSEYRLSVSGFTAPNGVFGDYFNLGDQAKTLNGSHFCAKDHCNNSVNPCAVWHKGAWWNRLDVCQTNPQEQSHIYWIHFDGTKTASEYIYMSLNPA